MEPILSVDNLSVRFPVGDSDVLAVRDVSFSIGKGETLGFVGESGCGKSVTAFSVLRLVPPPGVIDKGSITYKGRDVLSLEEDEVRGIRGREIAMIFQEPMTSLNPLFTIGYQIKESIILHMGMSDKEADEYAAQLLSKVGIPTPKSRLNSYPHEFSGGMRQRVMIAMALSASPAMLIADEPTTALDVTIQAQILDLLMKIQEERQMSLMLITHDLGVVANVVDAIAIMYAGEIIEYGTTAEIFSNPGHPYTRGLFAAIPKIGSGDTELKTINGAVPAINKEPGGCVFHPRCPYGIEECQSHPVTLDSANGRSIRCIRYGDI